VGGPVPHRWIAETVPATKFKRREVVKYIPSVLIKEALIMRKSTIRGQAPRYLFANLCLRTRTSGCEIIYDQYPFIRKRPSDSDAVNSTLSN